MSAKPRQALSKKKKTRRGGKEEIEDRKAEVRGKKKPEKQQSVPRTVAGHARVNRRGTVSSRRGGSEKERDTNLRLSERREGSLLSLKSGGTKLYKLIAASRRRVGEGGEEGAKRGVEITAWGNLGKESGGRVNKSKSVDGDGCRESSQDWSASIKKWRKRWG